MYETSQRVFTRCACAQRTGFLIKFFNQESVLDLVDCLHQCFNIQVGVDTFGERHGTGVSHNLLDPTWASVSMEMQVCRVQCGVWSYPSCSIRGVKYATTNRDGYREYKSDPGLCAKCPTREFCTHSKDCVKTVQRHVWKDYEELADDARYTQKYRDLYKRRKETIERVFADAKEKHTMRYAQYRGLAQVTNWVKLKFAAMNLHKLANWKWKEQFLSWFFHLFSLCVPKPRLPLAAQPVFSTG